MTIETKDSYEQRQLQEIQVWKSEKPSVVSELVGTVFKPITWLVNSVIPVNAVQSAIDGCNAFSKKLIDINEFKNENNISELQELKNVQLNECDKLADEVHNWAIGIATAEGATTGAGGLVGMALDIPAIITLAFRTINKIGLCYGFENNSEQENKIVLSILSASGANSIAEKQASLLTLRQLQVIIMKTTWKKMAQKSIGNEFSKEAGIMLFKGLAKQLGINLTKRKALQTIPIIGAAVGASVNAYYIKEVGWAARRVYQERWLHEKYRESFSYDKYEQL